MLLLSDEIAGRLRCSNCREILSCAPVLITAEGSSICGRCSVTKNKDHPLVRNKAYEDLACMVLFPCKFKSTGCEAALPMKEMKDHEDSCEFRAFPCPSFYDDCSWTGTRLDLVDHFKLEHPELVADHPIKLKLDLHRECQKNMLLVLYGFLFLVQVRYAAATTKLRYCVRILSNCAVASMFNFILHISSEQGQLTKNKGVQALQDFGVNKENSVEVNVNGLIGDLGDYSDVDFLITIHKVKDKHCCAIEHIPKCKGEVCIKKQGMYLCKNVKRGCDYVDKDRINVEKHEFWLCRYNQSECSTCDVSINEESWLEHWINHHTTFKCCSETLFKYDLEPDVYYQCCITLTEDCVFFCSWMLDQQHIDVGVVSNLLANDAQNYVVHAKFINQRTRAVMFENDVFYVSGIKEYVGKYEWSLICRHFKKLPDQYIFEFQIIK